MDLNDIAGINYTDKTVFISSGERIFAKSNDEYIDVTDRKAVLYGVSEPSFRRFDEYGILNVGHVVDKDLDKKGCYVKLGGGIPAGRAA